MFPTGSVVNAAAIIAGSLVGIALNSRFPDRIREVVFQGLGLCVLLIGMQMALEVKNPLVVVCSVLLGGITGELLGLEHLFERLASRLKRTIRSKNARFTDGLITASLIYCIGAMAIVGSFTEGLTGDGSILFTKSILDGFASIALASSYGTGVLFSFIPVLLYQGALTLGAGFFQAFFSDLLIAQLTATGGVLILGIGITLMDIKQIRLSSLLPALVYVVVITLILGG